jgi:RNA polymerase sigma factor (sigma-70 family)
MGESARPRGDTLTVDRHKLVAWVGSQVLPHEADVRRWLQRTLRVRDEIDDVIQEAYCRLAALGDVSHIDDPRAYFFRVTRNVVLAQMRRARVVRIETMTEIESLDLVADDPSPERVVAARWELARVQRAIASLPERCRRIVELRKLRGVSQREIARMLAVSENTVENEAARGVRLIVEALAEYDGDCGRDREMSVHERTRQRSPNR